MKRLAGMILLLLLALSSMAQVKGYKIWALNDLISDNRFVWQGDTIDHDLIVYVDLRTDSLRVRYIDGSWSNWFYSGTTSGVYVLPTASATVKGGIKVGSGLNIDGLGVLSSSGGSTNLAYTASATNGIVTSDTGTDATIPAGSTTNSSLMLPGDKTKLNGIASGADNYGSWTLNAGGATTVPSGYSVNLIEGSNIDINQSGLDITINSTGGSMVYPGAGIPISTGSAWGTSITDNSANWNTAYSNRIATFTTTGNSGAATFSGNTLNIPNYTLAGLGGIPEVTVAGLNFRQGGATPSWVSYSGNVSQTSTYARIFLTASHYWDLVPATSSYVGLMSGTDKSNLDGLVTDKGKVQTSGGTLAYLNDSYFTLLGGWKPTTESTPTYLSDKPFSSGGAYTQLGLKADLTGASFTGAISSTSTMTATDFIISSDRRLKENITPLKTTEWTRRIKFVEYNFKNTDRRRYGVIAQEVEKWAPELVTKDENGMKAVSYIDLLVAKIVDLENRIKALENEK